MMKIELSNRGVKKSVVYKLYLSENEHIKITRLNLAQHITSTFSGKWGSCAGLLQGCTKNCLLHQYTSMEIKKRFIIKV